MHTQWSSWLLGINTVANGVFALVMKEELSVARGKSLLERQYGTELCAQYGYKRVGNYSFTNNVWNDDNSGACCIYVPSTSPSTFSAIWQWLSQPARVHAYPRIQFESPHLPVQVSSLQSLSVSLAWNMFPRSLDSLASKDPTTHPNAAALDAIGTQSNVVMDLFCDSDRNRSAQPSEQEYEIMIWFGRLGDASQPIGMAADESGILDMSVEGVDFTLYNGTNSNGQTVYSWVSPSIVTSFTGDVTPLLHALPQYGLMPRETYIGLVQFGSETYYAREEVVFEAEWFEAELVVVPNENVTTSGGGSGHAEPLPDQSESAAVRAGIGTDVCVWRCIVLGIGLMFAWSSSGFVTFLGS